MKSKILLFIVILITNLTANGQTNSYFPNLTKVLVDTSLDTYFSYDKKTTLLINKPCYLLNPKDPFFSAQDSAPVIWTVIAKYKSENLNDSLTIVFSPGHSDDPEFLVYSKTKKEMGRFNALDFYINAAGTFYVSGHTNNMFNRRRKFQIQNDAIIETQQPYYYVGMKGKTLKGITLYTDTIGNEIVAQLPKDYEIEILLAMATTKDFELDKLFLVRTDFGLVGWLRLEGYGEPVLQGFVYAGD